MGRQNFMLAAIPRCDGGLGGADAEYSFETLPCRSGPVDRAARSRLGWRETWQLRGGPERHIGLRHLVRGLHGAAISCCALQADHGCRHSGSRTVGMRRYPAVAPAGRYGNAVLLPHGAEWPAVPRASRPRGQHRRDQGCGDGRPYRSDEVIGEGKGLLVLRDEGQHRTTIRHGRVEPILHGVRPAGKRAVRQQRARGTRNGHGRKWQRMRPSWFAVHQQLRLRHGG